MRKIYQSEVSRRYRYLQIQVNNEKKLQVITSQYLFYLLSQRILKNTWPALCCNNNLLHDLQSALRSGHFIDLALLPKKLSIYGTNPSFVELTGLNIISPRESNRSH